MDIAVQEFNLLGLQNDNLQLQLAHSSAAAVASAELKALKEKYQEVLQTVQEQEKLIQQQAKDLDECKAWILGHVASTTHSRRIDSAISHELEALEGRGCVTQSVWSSRFQPGVLSGKLESIKQQQTAVAQVVALHVRVGQSVQAHALRVADAVKLEQALLEGVGDGPHPPTLVSVPASMANAPDPATIAHLPAPAGLAKHDGDNPAKEHHRTFDHVALEIGTLVGRYSPVQAS
ncbi:hypothetical protein DYB32_000125 [Aphanomyces invadans]|uniref:Uncharacterized protein n=1 Tax=Aphanomyces invadans TaxID=157072 RepID=A0A3R6Z6F5_9STRA|nr:hypothetical protein DYB32_000125 [Aphanomyces invadans]